MSSVSPWCRFPGSNPISLLLATGALLGSDCSQTEDVKPDPVRPATNTEAGAQALYGWACPKDTSGARMVLIETPDANAYCIDERETSYAEYKQFLLAMGEDTSGQPEECKSNDSFVPPLDQNGMECEPVDWQIDALPDRPVNCIDFCDAWAYCQWAGKRLCGIVGADNSKVNDVGSDFGSVGTSVQSEWFNACSQGGRTKYPYGDDYQPGTCTDEDQVAAKGEDARNITDNADNACHGTIAPFDAVLDLSGSVLEWSNLCRSDGCSINGGSYADGRDLAQSLGCARNGSAVTISRGTLLGMRCCADAVAVPHDDNTEPAP